MTNSTEENGGTNKEQISFIEHLVELPVIFLAIIAQTLLILSHYKDPLHVFKNTATLFVRNIAVIDICVAFLWSIRIVLKLLGNDVKIVSFIWVGFATLSPWAFLSLAIERFVSVGYPLWHRVRVTIPVCRKILIGTWVLHTALHLLSGGLTPKNNDILVFCGSLLFLSVFIVYFVTYVTLRRQGKHLERRQDLGQATSNLMKARQKQEKRFLATMAIVAFILVIAYLPIIGFNLLKTVLNIQKIPEVYSTFMILLSLGLLSNPIVYLLRLPKYRKTFKVLYCNFL